MQIEKIHIKELQLYTKPAFQDNGEGLRLAINSKWQDNPNLHGHDENGNSLYRSPPVRYIPRDMPILVAIENGFDELENIYEAVDEKIRVYSREYDIVATEMSDREYEFGTSDELFTYRSISPWVALNQKRYHEYIRYGSYEKRRKLLHDVMIGNILSMAKGLEIWLKEKIFLKIENFHEIRIEIKQVSILVFKVQFTANIVLPENMGLGKHVSLGFGRFERTD